MKETVIYCDGNMTKEQIEALKKEWEAKSASVMGPCRIVMSRTDEEVSHILYWNRFGDSA